MYGPFFNERLIIYSDLLVTSYYHALESSGKAGRSRWLGRRPHNRGVVMNPVDHPMATGMFSKGSALPISGAASFPDINVLPTCKPLGAIISSCSEDD